MKQPQEHRVDHERNEDEPPKPCCLHFVQSLDDQRSLPAVLGFDGDGHLGDAGLAGVVHHIDHPPVLHPLIRIDQD